MTTSCVQSSHLSMNLNHNERHDNKGTLKRRWKPKSKSRSPRSPSSPSSSLLHFLLLLLLLFYQERAHVQVQVQVQAQKFEPYTLNGGLISAVAGRDYVVIASDTRLSEGYEILSRDYLTSRIWAAVPLVEDLEVADDNANNFEEKENDLGGEAGQEAGDNANVDADVRINPDGSMSLLSKRALLSKTSKKATEPSLSSTCTSITQYSHLHSVPSPTFIASAGCAADCEALKRQLKNEVNSHLYWNYGSDSNSDSGSGFRSGLGSPSGVANLLGQTLYSRRAFPFYSFCILAGLDLGGNSNGSGSGSGVVHIYDAIGSHERVAVATAGTGREMLQPILDRLFTVASSSSSSSFSSFSNGNKEQHVNDNNHENTPGSTANLNLNLQRNLQRDGRAVLASKQRIGTSLKLQPPVQTCVSCTSEEAVACLLRGYRSVAEREIAVGDSVVICVLKLKSKGQMGMEEGINGCTLEVSRFPLKRH
mmetsp:Transcript_25109/g.37563  ORF Transcript_25109/g.37563 Transcript_25109/m.37563 type:complete len:479 (+) Transcript_25109:42-1478(+)